MAAEKGFRRGSHSSRASIRALVKECRPGAGTLVSQPQAAMASVTEVVPPGIEEAAADAEKPSRRMSTSDMDCSNRLWNPIQSREM